MNISSECPSDTNDVGEDFEILYEYNDPDADTIIYYDEDGDQHVQVKDEDC